MRRIILCGQLLALAALAGGSAAQAQEAKNVKGSVDAAIGYLKRTFADGRSGEGGVTGPVGFGANLGGPPPATSHEEGPAALAGIAMVEAGVPLSDPVIQGIAKKVREACIAQNKVYQLSLDLIFLDKLGEEIDTKLIQSIGARLLISQTARGGWGYRTPMLDQNEQARLRGALEGAVLKGGRDLPQVGQDVDNRPRLDEGAADILRGQRLARADNEPAGPMDDNSNTQFAIIAIWSARRHGLPVENAMKLIEQRFRTSQQPWGGWTYVFNSPYERSPSMTCAGLLGLAIISGAKNERSMRSRGTIGADGKIKIDSKDSGKPVQTVNPLNDRQVQSALTFLGQVLNAPINNGPPKQQGGFPGAPGFPGGGPPGGLPPGPMGAGAGGPADTMNTDIRKDFYFLWSLERVAVVFNLSKIGNKDWHAWGADYLMATQSHDGSWSGKYGPSIDTSFGLMFMIRSNIVKDLTRLMKGGVGDFKPGAGDAAAADPKKPGDKPPAAAAPPEWAAMADTLVKAGPTRQKELIKEYEKEPGAKYSRALADSIPKLTGDLQTEARDALAQRMARMSARSLEGYLDDDNPEMRRAAALGAAMREEKDLIPILIDVLDDESELVWRAARVALRELTGKDFGPKPGDNDAKRQKAITEWRDWLKTSKK